MLQNVSQQIESNVRAFTVGEIYAMHHNKEFFYDREKLQRLLIEWIDWKKASYLTFLFNGGSCKDLFQIAEIDPIIESLRSRLTRNEPNYEFIKDNLEYFENISNQGFKYLVLDGQHRIDTIARYFEDRINFKPLSLIELKNPEESGSIYVKGLFSKMPEEAQEYLRDIPVVVTTYRTGDLRELAQVFITSNDMMPMTNHERRILNYNPINRWIIDLCRDDMNLRWTLSKVKQMSGEYSLDHKGDTLFVAEMLRYINCNTYEGYNERDLNAFMGSYPDPQMNIVISSKDKELTAKILRIMADGCVAYGESKLKKFSRSSLYNMFYTISFLLQKGNNWSKPIGIDGQYTIKNASAFAKWFLDKEHARLNATGTYSFFTSPSSKKQKKSAHEWSFNKHNGDQKHSSKESVTGEGGSRYTFTDWARVRYILADLKEDLTNLENAAIIAKVGSRSGVSRDEALVEAGVPLSESHKYEVNEIVPVARGGHRIKGNYEVIETGKNRMQSARPNPKEVVNG